MPRFTALTACLLLGACATAPAGPPPSGAGGAWIEPQAPGGVSDTWWTLFGDPQLVSLIDQAVAGSPDLRAADARLAEARAVRDVVHGAEGPQGGAEAAYSRNRLSANGQIPIGRIPGFRRDLSLFDAGFDASWEVDLWGRNRAAARAAGDRTHAAESARRETLLRLRAEVARTYLTLRAAQARLDCARADAAAQTALAVLVARRVAAGESARGDLDRAESQARAASGGVPTLEADEREAAYALARLLGRPPEAVAATLLIHRPIPIPPTLFGAGLRSDVLRRRPDVAQAEAQLAAARADIRVARADLFPRLYLSGLLGQQSQSLGDIAQAARTRFQAGPQVSWPILQRGAIKANIRAAGARADGAAATYEAAVFAALADSETALNRAARTSAALREAERSAQAARDGLGLVERRHAAGEDDLSVVLVARSSLAQAERRLADARLGAAVAVVAAFKALGV